MVSEPALAKAGDEARVGQKNGLTYQWASKGERPRQPKDQRYDSAYIFGAICPARGTGAALVMPYANTEAMNGHLAEIAMNVAPGAHAVVLIDGAGWHTSKAVSTPTNITLLKLPAYCPELNAQANIWQYMRQNWLSNRIFADYAAIREPEFTNEVQSHNASHQSEIVTGRPSVRIYEGWYKHLVSKLWRFLEYFREKFCP